MTYSLMLKIEGLPKITSNGSHSSWRAAAAEKRKWKHLTMAHIHANMKPLEPLKKAKAVFTRHSSMRPDDDNLAISFKNCRDALTEAGVIIDDKSSVLTAKYEWRSAPPKKGFITIEVSSVD